MLVFFELLINQNFFKTCVSNWAAFCIGGRLFSSACLAAAAHMGKKASCLSPGCSAVAGDVISRDVWDSSLFLSVVWRWHRPAVWRCWELLLSLCADEGLPGRVPPQSVQKLCVALGVLHGFRSGKRGSNNEIGNEDNMWLSISARMFTERL